MKKPRYAVRHKPTGKFFYEDEGGSFLVPEEDGFMTFGTKSTAEDLWQNYPEEICLEEGDFPKNEFEIIEL